MTQGINTEVSRRGFLKGAAASGAGIAALGLLGGCAPKTGTDMAETGASADNHNGEVSSGGVDFEPDYTGDGRYVTKSLGHEGYVHVATEIWDGKIASVKVVSQRETIGIGTYACTRIPAAIAENQSVNVPNIRGCSVTCEAIKRAVSEAIEKAGLDLAAFSTPVEEPDVNQSETLDVDAVVVGGGTAGLVCGAKLADMGYQVLVLEKHGIPGGSGPMSYSGIIAPDTKQIRALNYDGSIPPDYASQEGKIESLKATSDPATDRYNGASPFSTLAYPAITRSVDWMVDSCGIGFQNMGFYEGAASVGYTSYLAPGMYMGGAGYQTMTLAKRLEGLPNSEIKYMTKVTELIQDADGRVIGVKAVGLKSDDSENGYELTVNAKAVVLCTGSYVHNKELLAEYEPEFVDESYHCCSASTGDGQVMGLAAGSKIECTGLHFPAYPATATYFEIAFITAHAPFTMVNDRGGYIGTDDFSHAGMSQAARDENNGGRFFTVLDASAEPTLGFNPAMGYSTYDALYDRGEVLYYDTPEAAAEDLNLPELPAYLEEINAKAQAGEKNALGAPYNYFETRAGIYLIPSMPCHYLTPSGLCIDPQMRVLTDSYVMDGENTSIPGLYAAGDVSGTISTREGRGYFNGFPLAIGCGYLAAETVAEDFPLA